MTCRSPRRENSAFSPATAVVSVLRKPGSTKIFATAMLAAVAIAITITASGLWDDSTLAALFDNPAAPATVIPNVSDVWYALDAVDSIISSEWLIPPAFAATTIEALGNQTVTEGDTVTISAIITSDEPDFTLFWFQNSPYEPDLGFVDFDDTPTITFPAPPVVANTDFVISIYVNGDERVESTMTLTILNSTSTVTNNPPTVNAGDNPDTITKGSTVTLRDATASDFEDNDADLIILWTQNPANTVTITDEDTISPTITVPVTTTATSVTLTLRVIDDDGNIVEKTRVLTIQEDDVNDRPTVDAGDPLSVALDSSVTPNSTFDDLDGSSGHAYTWTSSDPGAVTFSPNANSLRPTITVPVNTTPTDNIILTLTVVDGEYTESDTTTLRIFDPSVNVEPTVKITGNDIPVKERTSVTLTGTASDPNKDTLAYSWEYPADVTTTVTGKDTRSLRFTTPGISSGPQSFDFTLTVTDPGDLTASDTVTVTVEDVPLEAPYVTYNPGNGQLKIIFNQDIESNPTSYDNIHVRSTGSNSGDISLSDVDKKSHSGRTITATLSTAQQERYAGLQNPQLDIDRGAVTDADGVSIGDTSDIAIRTISNKKSSSSIAPIVDLRTLEQARIVDIPQSILEQVSSHDDFDPLKSISHNGMFDLPLAINGYYYLLDDTTNTLIPQTVTAGQSTEIVFTVYTEEDLAHFILYLNMQGNDVNYAYSDTYITYKNDDPVSVTDKHGYIADATITVTQEDDSMPEKKTVRITIHFDEPMGSTNMVAYMWNTDRKAAFIKMIGALEVVAAAETSETDSSPRSSNPAGSGSEPDTPKDDQGSTSTPSIIKSGIVIVGDDDDDAQTLSLIRMWSGFESESLTDAELLESLNLDYPGVDIPNWMMTELGALVSTGDVTVEEFRTALVYMLEMLTA